MRFANITTSWGQEDADVLEAYDKLAYYLDHEFEKT